jgi:lipid-A-disaccharide synthase-like uncharacterized protein
MRRRWLLAAEVGLVLAVAIWAGLALRPRRGDVPPDAVDIKVQLRDASDRAYLTRDSSGAPRYLLTLKDGTRLTLSPDEFARRIHDDQHSRSWLEVVFNVSSPLGFAWVALGLIGQALFTGRMIVQWLVSEKQSRSVVPPAFWWMSLAGASMLLVYFLWRRDAVGVLGQSVGWFVYLRNLWFIHGRRAEGATS